MTSNMKIWDAVSKTNPKNTKHVGQRGGFTSICAQSQIMEATRQFGPIGEGWGYSAGNPIFQDGLVFVQVSLWHGTRDNSFGPVIGGAEWRSDKGRLDSDAPKKATTDALTKLLSQLGFNADVFLGLYDDDKYVERVREEFAEKPPTITPAQLDELQLLFDHLNVPVSEFLTMGKLKRLSELAADRFDKAKSWINQRANELREHKEAA